MQPFFLRTIFKINSIKIPTVLLFYANAVDKMTHSSRKNPIRLTIKITECNSIMIMTVYLAQRSYKHKAE